MSDEIGARTRALLRDQITSFEMLEVFLLLRAHPEQGWTAAAVAERLHVPADLVANALDSLKIHQIAEATPPLDAAAFRYRPATAQLAEAGEDLARDFADKRAAVLLEISANAIERVRSHALGAFADAFVLGGKQKDG